MGTTLLEPKDERSHTCDVPPAAAETVPTKPRPCIPWCRGMVDDLKRRKPHYLADWTDGCHPKIISSSLFMFFTSIAPAITFAAVLDRNTREDGVAQIGPVEVILSTALTGAIFSVFGGQPLCIVGVTGPVSIFTTACFTISSALRIKFLPFYCWVQLWSALMHILLAISGACRAIDLVSRYSCETFGMLIAVIYIFTGVQNLILYFHDKELDVALLSLLLGLGTAWLALALAGARAWSFFSRQIRVSIADYAATLSIVLFCVLPYAAAFTMTPAGQLTNANSSYTLATLAVPDSFSPTASGRPWLLSPAECPGWAIALAIGPAALLTVLFFFDHNVSSLLCQAPEFGLRKGSAYHWDFFVIGIQILITGLLGIPPVNGLIPQAPLHTDSLCEKAFRTDPKTGQTTEVIVKCHEQRVSNLMQAVLIGCMMPAIRIVGYLPIAVLDGLFLFMGIASFGGSTFYHRLLLFFTDRERRAMRRLPFLDTVPMPTIRLFTLTQLLVLACIFTITRFHFVDGFFPFLIAILVPVRLYLLPRLFGAAHVDAMDAVGAAPDEVLVVVDWETKGGAGAGGMDVDVVVTPETAHELTPPVPCRRGVACEDACEDEAATSTTRV